jgi:hypothetical protein
MMVADGLSMSISNICLKLKHNLLHALFLGEFGGLLIRWHLLLIDIPDHS